MGLYRKRLLLLIEFSPEAPRGYATSIQRGKMKNAGSFFVAIA
jgi:hypothetical protein